MIIMTALRRGHDIFSMQGGVGVTALCMECVWSGESEKGSIRLAAC